MADRRRSPSPPPSAPEWALAELEVLARLDMVRRVCEEILTGGWAIDTDVDGAADIFDALAQLVAQAARWAERADALRLAS